MSCIQVILVIWLKMHFIFLGSKADPPNSYTKSQTENYFNSSTLNDSHAEQEQGCPQMEIKTC